MIEVPRGLIRQFVSVWRTSVWAASGRRSIPPVLFQTSRRELEISSQFEGVAVRYVKCGQSTPSALGTDDASTYGCR
jgi:hypothetical protein